MWLRLRNAATGTALAALFFLCTCGVIAQDVLPEEHSAVTVSPVLPMQGWLRILSGPPKVYVDPAGPYEVPPGGNINITCSAVGFPFPEAYWKKGQEAVRRPPTKQRGVLFAISEQLLMIKELTENSEFTCHGQNALGHVNRTVKIIITGPGSPPIIRGVKTDRTQITIRWDPPRIINRPITGYSVYYTADPHQPIKNWKRLEVNEPEHEISIPDLKPSTTYHIRLRANDAMGPGQLGPPISDNTAPPDDSGCPRCHQKSLDVLDVLIISPTVMIVQGEELRVPPLVEFTIKCKVTRSDPTPWISWHHEDRPMKQPVKVLTLYLKHRLVENTQFSCVAENEAGTMTKRINITITGPTSPERIRYMVDGDKVFLTWEQPRITNGPMTGYDVFYTNDSTLPEDQWMVHHVDDPNARATTIPNLNERKSYTFIIRGRNKLGLGLPSNKFEPSTWLGARPPLVTVTPVDEELKNPSENEMSFKCEALGLPKPKIVWYWNDVPIADGKDEFRIYDLPSPDAEQSLSKLTSQSNNRTGVVKCTGVNSVGTGKAQIYVKIHIPGSPPLHSQPTSLPNEFDVLWPLPKSGREKDSVDNSKDSNVPPSDMKSVTVEDGNPRNLTVQVDNEHTPYVAKDHAVTDDGSGVSPDAPEVPTGRKDYPPPVTIIQIGGVQNGSNDDELPTKFAGAMFMCLDDCVCAEADKIIHCDHGNKTTLPIPSQPLIGYKFIGFTCNDLRELPSERLIKTSFPQLEGIDVKGNLNFDCSSVTNFNEFSVLSDCGSEKITACEMDKNCDRKCSLLKKLGIEANAFF